LPSKVYPEAQTLVHASVIPECFKAGISVTTGIIVGYPGEGEVEFLETIKVLGDLKDYIEIVHSSSIFKIPSNTPIYDDPEKYGIDPNNLGLDWKSIDGLNTLEVREKRIEHLRNHVTEIGVSWA